MNFSLILPEFIIHYHRRCGGGFLMWPSDGVNPGFRLTGRSQNNQFRTADFCLRPQPLISKTQHHHEGKRFRDAEMWLSDAVHPGSSLTGNTLPQPSDKQTLE